MVFKTIKEELETKGYTIKLRRKIDMYEANIYKDDKLITATPILAKYKKTLLRKVSNKIETLQIVKPSRIVKGKGRLQVENWKGVNYVVARDTHGRILTKTKKDKKVKVSEYRDIFSKNLTFQKDVTKRKLSKVYEISEPIKNFKLHGRPQNVQYQIILKDKKGNKKYITAKSKAIYRKKDIKAAESEAYDNLLSRVGEFLGGEYDTEDGRIKLKTYTGGYSISSNLVRYENV